MVTTRWGGLRLEPYNPNAVDADGDGIVQEGTAWERPGGTTLVDELGRAIRTGVTSPQRPAKMRVQRDGKDIDYTPTYGKTPVEAQKPEAPGKPTALGRVGYPSLQERGLPTLKSMFGTIGEPMLPPPGALTQEQIRAGWDIFQAPRPELLGQLKPQDLAEAGAFRRMLDKALSKVDEPEERTRISNLVLNSFYWGSVSFDKSGGSIPNLINNIWSGAQDAGYNPHEVLEEMWRAGGAFAITIPMMRLKEKFKLTKQEVNRFSASVRNYMREKKIEAGEFSDAFKNKVRSVFRSMRTNNDVPGLEFDIDSMETIVDVPTDMPFLPSPVSAPIFAMQTTRPTPSIPPTPEEPALPRYPRQPPASAFKGKAAEVFGNAKSWNEFWDLMKDNEIVFLDYETTGLEDDGIPGKVKSNGMPTQIGAVRMKNGEVIDRFNVYINPGRPHSKWTQWSQDNLRDQDGNLITQEFLDRQISSAEAHARLIDWVGTDAIMGAQNVIFDEEVLMRSLADAGIDWRPAGWLDTKEIADMTLPRWSEQNQDAPFRVNADGSKAPSNSLGDITRYLGVNLGANHHTADHDAAATGEVLNRIVRGGIEKGWSADVLDPAKRAVKEQKNQDDFTKAISDFEQKLAEYNKTIAPRWVDIESILAWEDLGMSDPEEQNLDGVGQEVADDWNDWDPCREMRQQAYRIAGLQAGPTDPNIGLTGGYWGNGAGPRTPGDPDKRYEQAKYLMASLAEHTHKGSSYDKPTLYRAMDLDGDDADGFWGAVQVGEEIDIPLLAFADRRRQGHNEFLSDYGKDVLLVLEDSPGSVELGYFSPMWSDDDEAATIDDLRQFADSLEEDLPDDEEFDTSISQEIRSLLDEYEKTSVSQRDERQRLRDELSSIAADFGLPTAWAGDDPSEEGKWDFENPLLSPRERASGGRMEVLSIEDDPDGVYGKVVRLRQIGVFDPTVPGRLIKRKL